MKVVYKVVFITQTYFPGVSGASYPVLCIGSCHEKNGFLPMQKQRRRSAVQLLYFCNILW